MTQTVFTVITAVDPLELETLRQVVNQIGADPAANAVLPLEGFDRLHFASLVLVQSDDLPPSLIFEHNVDGSLDAWLDMLVAERAAGLNTLYAHCRDYPGAGCSSAELRAYLGEHVVRPGAYHVGATGRSLSRIRQEAELRRAIDGNIDSEIAAGAAPVDAAGWRSSIQQFVAVNPALSWGGGTGSASPDAVETMGP